MQIHHIDDEMRSFITDTEEDKVILVAFQERIKTFDPDNCTRKERKRLKQAWIRMERQLGEKLLKSNGFTRDEVFN